MSPTAYCPPRAPCWWFKAWTRSLARTPHHPIQRKTIRAAVQAGYKNATRTIVDANVTTLIVAGILLWFGTGAIKGFAVTLSIGILSSMFTALIMTRVIMEFVTRKKGRTKISI